ncbi:MAG: hypothetical protein KA715_02290 [Xanthomonadaceae bacterium]|nr:hypothetical protein [Xanthomonadaceae bacterium]
MIPKEIVHRNEILNRARESGQFGHHDKVDVMPLDRLKHLLKFGPLHVLGRFPCVSEHVYNFTKVRGLIPVADLRLDSFFLVFDRTLDCALFFGRSANVERDFVPLGFSFIIHAASFSYVFDSSNFKFGISKVISSDLQDLSWK